MLRRHTCMHVKHVGVRHLVEHVPDGCAGLVDGGAQGHAPCSQARQVPHDVEGRKGIQPCGVLAL